MNGLANMGFLHGENYRRWEGFLLRDRQKKPLSKDWNLEKIAEGNSADSIWAGLLHGFSVGYDLI